MKRGFVGMSAAVTVREDEAESALTAFTVVARCDDSGRFPADTLETALAMDLFGARTMGGHIGLFGGFIQV